MLGFGGMGGFGRMFDEMQAMCAVMERQMAHELGGMRLDHHHDLVRLGNPNPSASVRALAQHLARTSAYAHLSPLLRPLLQLRRANLHHARA
jgi:hypothetical protein